jgi:hypothetical protein
MAINKSIKFKGGLEKEVSSTERPYGHAKKKPHFKKLLLYKDLSIG